MYSHEIGLILDQLSDWNKPSVDVQTVDSYQGKEGEAIVIHCSAAWKNLRSPIGFLTNIRRLNVGITRAKSFMFIVGNLSFWESRITTLPNDTSRDRSGKRKFPMNETDGHAKDAHPCKVSGYDRPLHRHRPEEVAASLHGTTPRSLEPVSYVGCLC
jgi:hypothetical protein